MPATLHRRWSEAEVRRLIDEAPFPAPRLELVDGELLVTPAPGRMHQRLVLALAKALDTFVRAHALGEVCLSPSDVRLLPELVVQPDVFVIPNANGQRPRASDPITQLLVALEVISPTSARFDRFTKRRAYQAAHVFEYWIVDPDARMIERWLPNDTRPEVLDQELTWCPVAGASTFTLDLAVIFADVADEC